MHDLPAHRKERPAQRESIRSRVHSDDASGTNAVPRPLKWRTDKMCMDCPFHSSGPGLHLRNGLRRWGEILASLKRDEHFFCHRTTGEEDDEGETIITGEELLCSGAIEWQIKNNGQPSQLARVMERVQRRPNANSKDRVQGKV